MFGGRSATGRRGSKRLRYDRWAVYRDETNSNTVLVHLNVEDVDRAKQWFQSDAFKGAAKRAGKVSRDVWFAQAPS